MVQVTAGVDDSKLRLLGLLRRAGRAVVGTEAVREAARRDELAGAVLASDAGRNARDRVVPMLASLGIPWVELGDRTSLGRAVGRPRATVVGLRDGDLTRRILGRTGRVEDNAQEERR